MVPFLLGAAAAPAAPAGDVVFTFRTRRSWSPAGWWPSDGLFVTINDSGDAGRVFAVDPTTGRTVGVTEWARDPVDVEALAPAADGRVWVGDIGDNRSARDSVRCPGPGRAAATGPSTRRVRAGLPRTGARDAETLLVDPATGRLYVATKDVFGGTLFAAPATLLSGPAQPAARSSGRGASADRHRRRRSSPTAST